MKTVTDSSGIRLMRLINTRVLDIARLELDNSCRICLYGTGGWWTAFDRSAYALSHLFPDLASFVVSPPGSPFSVVGLSVDERTLKRYMKNHDALRQSPDYLELASSPVEMKEYDSWHSKVVNGFMEIVHAS